MSEAIISPGAVVTKVLFTKREASTWSGYEVKCEIQFFDGSSIKYKIERSMPLFEEEYPKGIYQWDGKNYTQLENWEE